MAEKIYKHFVRVDERGRILHGYSDALETPRDGDVLHNEQTNRQFQLCFADGSLSDENVTLLDEPWRVPLFVLVGEFAAHRLPEEIRADRPEPSEPQPDPIDELRDRVEKIEEVLKGLTGGEPA